MPEDRRLAAIMFTDIVGYTALMGSDEDSAFKLLRKNRDIQRPLIKKYRGKWLKEMGDGILASFNSASDAVRCAIEIQQISKKESVPLRIGIHEGEVVFEGGDVLGDGVNVASRLEELGQKGCINISGAVYKDIKNKAGINAEFIEEKTLKNVDEPLQVYKVDCAENAGEQRTSNYIEDVKAQSKYPYYILSGVVAVIIAILIVWKFVPFKDKAEKVKSIAVMPFDNESADDDNIYFVNGMMEDIRNNLSQIGDILVISKTSTEKYRDSKLSTKELGKELDVSYLLEGTVQKIGNQVKIHAQLISVENDDHLWQDTYERDISDVTKVFKVQSDIAKIIADELNAGITPEEKKRIEGIPTDNFTAYEYYLQAWDYLYKYEEVENITIAEDLINNAIKLDPFYAKAYVIKAIINHHKWKPFVNRNRLFLDSILFYSNKALSINDELSEAYELRGVYYLYDFQFEKGISNLEHALLLNPNSAWSYNLLGQIKSIYKDCAEGLKLLIKAVHLERGNDLKWFTYQLIHSLLSYEMEIEALNYYLRLQKFDPAIKFNDINDLFFEYYIDHREFSKAQEYINKNKNSLFFRLDSAIHFSKLGYLNMHKRNYKEAEVNYRKLLELSHNYSYVNDFHNKNIGYVLWQLGMNDEALIFFKEQIDLCKLAINREFFYSEITEEYDLASIYAFLGENEKAFYYLEMYESKKGFYSVYDKIKIDPLFEKLYGNQEFQGYVQRAQETKASIIAQIQEMKKNGEF